MSNGNDRTPVLQNEDWWGCFIGWFILLLAVVGYVACSPENWYLDKFVSSFSQGGRYDLDGHRSLHHHGCSDVYRRNIHEV